MYSSDGQGCGHVHVATIAILAHTMQYYASFKMHAQIAIVKTIIYMYMYYQ